MSSDFELVNLRVKANLLSDAYRALFGHDPERGFTIPELMPAASPSALALSGLIARLARVPRYIHPGAPAMERRLQEAALFELLMSWSDPNSAILGPRASVPRSARLARDFIEAHLLDAPTLTDIAAAAGVGVRALTRSFKRTYAVSPMGYMSKLRLEHARDELRNSVPGTTVTDVAYRWGFSNLGDFAAAYARRFSELPSTTLRRRTGP
jgi:AraC-like DNA-binding protein